MSIRTHSLAAVAAGYSLVALSALSAEAQTDIQQLEPIVVITADRQEEPLTRSGSSVTVVPSTQVERYGSKGVADALRGVAGVEVRETGGVGAASQVSIRGANPGQTLVLLDGMRIGDPTATDGSVDFGNLVATDIERVEVLRGPQSALYGSDAMGGVINIITKRGKGPLKTSVTLEGGSYGTLHSRVSVSGSSGDVSYAFGLDALHVDGFPRYGYRIGRPILLSDGVTPLPPLPWGDPTNKGGANGFISYRLSDSASLDFGFAAFDNFIRFDNPFAFAPGNVFNARNHSHAGIEQGFVRLNADTFDGLLHNQLTLFGFMMDRQISQTEACFDPITFFSFDCRSGFRGTRRGAEYQGDLKLGAFGLLTFGLRTETETAKTSQDPAPAGTFTPINAQQTTNSVYAQDKIAFGDRLDVTVGGRVDAVSGGKTFATWRATASYRIDETGTRLHASAGTGAKNPSLFQRFSQFGFAGLAPEQSFGMDAGVTQKLFGDRITLDATYFDNEYRNLINFSAAPTCTALQLASAGGCYYNVGRARTYGVELSGDAILVPDEWKARATYTFMLSRDLIAGGPLLQRPRNQASASLIYTGFHNLEAEARVTFVGVRQDFFFPAGVTLAPYAKLDFLANYKINDTLSIFGRIENITNARYQEVFNYGVAGRAVYGGLKMTW